MSAAQSSKSAVVTGVTSGIGKALAGRLIAAGWRVYGVGRKPELLAQLREQWGEPFAPLRCDLAQPSARRDLIAELAERCTQLDVLVNNAGEVVYETPLQLSSERWHSLLEVNLLAGLELSQALMPALRASGAGHVVNVSSATARFVPNPRFAPYALTKAALDRLSEAVRVELAPAGIKVSSVAPGLTDTPIYDKVDGFGATRAKLEDHVPEWLRADDVAAAIQRILEQPAHVVVTDLGILPRAQPR